MVSASFNMADAAPKKKKEQKQAKPAPVQLTTKADTLSYAAGMTVTEGLMPFLNRQYGVTADNLQYVLEAFEKTMATGNDAKAKAYAAGQQVAFMVMERMLPTMGEQFKGEADSINTTAFTRGFVNALRGDNRVMADSTARTYFETAKKVAADKRSAAARKAGEDFLAANAKKEGVVTLPSGLQYKVLTKGTGEVPADTSEVTVKYEGRLIDGTVFDSSYERGDGTATFSPNQVIKGWTEALTMMPVGSKWELYIPQNLAYGDRDMGKIKPYSALVFTVEVVGIKKPEVIKAAELTPAKTVKKAATITQKAAKKPVRRKK